MAHVGSTVGERIVIRTEGETIGLRCGRYTTWRWTDTISLAHPGSGVSFAGNAEVHRPAAAQELLCHQRWHVVNMQYVRSVVGDDVLVEEENLHIGRPYKQKFLQAYAEYMVGGT